MGVKTLISLLSLIVGEVVDASGTVIYQLIGRWDKGMSRYNPGNAVILFFLNSTIALKM